MCPYVSKSKNWCDAPRLNPLTVAFVQSHHAVSYQSSLSENIICPSASSCSSTHPNDHKELPTYGRVTLLSFIHSWMDKANRRVMMWAFGSILLHVASRYVLKYYLRNKMYFILENVHLLTAYTISTKKPSRTVKPLGFLVSSAKTVYKT